MSTNLNQDHTPDRDAEGTDLNELFGPQSSRILTPGEAANSDDRVTESKIITPDNDIVLAKSHMPDIAIAPDKAMVREMQAEIEEIVDSYGLDYFPQIFELVDYKAISILAARDGFPVRYPHWRFGMAYDQFAKPYSMGQMKISEMVINTDPCIAYLMDSNPVAEQREVIAHVYGHNNFFVRNQFFAHTDRKMLDTMGNHRARVMRHIDKYGMDAVEAFIDTVRSIEDLIDVNSTGVKRRSSPEQLARDASTVPTAQRFDANDYMDSFLNPADRLQEADDKLAREHRQRFSRYPAEPQRDVLLFLEENAPLQDWQRDILSIIRDEAYYFAPQGQTKIMNEGWASYWHSKIMTQHLLHRYPGELTTYADHNSKVIAPHPQQLNPYRLGLAIWRDIEERWNKGRFGEEYENLTDMREKENWDKELGLGRQQMDLVRDVSNDATFISRYLTPELCMKENLFTFRKLWNETHEVKSRAFEQIRSAILKSLTNRGRPIIEVVDANYEGSGQLVLEHRHQGEDLDMNYAKDTLRNLYKLWGRPVHVKTALEDRQVMVSFDGHDHTTRKL